jgi:hypothetical protein
VSFKEHSGKTRRTHARKERQQWQRQDRQGRQDERRQKGAACRLSCVETVPTFEWENSDPLPMCSCVYLNFGWRKERGEEGTTIALVMTVTMTVTAMVYMLYVCIYDVKEGIDGEGGGRKEEP